MRLVVRILDLTLLDIELTDSSDDDPDEAQSLRPPLGFAGSGCGQTELSDDRMLDNIQGDRLR